MKTQEVTTPDLTSVPPSNVSRPLLMACSTLPLGGNHSLGWEASESLPCTWPPITTTTTTGSTPINGGSTATMAPQVLSSYDSTGTSALAASSGRTFFSQTDSPLNRPYVLWSLGERGFFLFKLPKMSIFSFPLSFVEEQIGRAHV